MSIRLEALYPNYCCNVGVGHTCLSLCDAMRAPGFTVRLTTPAIEPMDRRDFVANSVPEPFRTISCCRPFRRVRQWHAQHVFLQELETADYAYLWPGVSRWVYEGVRARGSTLVMERINCHRATSRRILDEAYDRLGWPRTHTITDAQVLDESRKLELADYVFCPSPFVHQSMLDARVDAGKLLSTSYGWDPARLSGVNPTLPPADGVTVLFVGLACVRKGIPLLLRAWSRAGIRGRLVLAGEIAPDIARYCGADLSRPDVLRVPNGREVGGVYASADIFVLPTLEEGSPLVTYEAMACGLACIVSPMGAGEIVRHGRDGILADAQDEDAWIDSMVRLARDRDLRLTLGEAARRRAADYTWSQVGARRRGRLEVLARVRSAGVHEQEWCARVAGRR